MTSGGSAAALHAFVAAREAAGNPDRPVAYMSNQSHSAQVRAARIVGITPDRIRVLPSDTSGRIDPGAVAEAIAADRAAGCTPTVVCANAGTPARGAVDPPPALADICAAELPSRTSVPGETEAATGAHALRWVCSTLQRLLRSVTARARRCRHSRSQWSVRTESTNRK